IRIIIDEVKSPFCEASPDFCNWEHEYLLYNGLKDLAPYAHTNVHAKYWNRWKDPDVRRNVRIMMDASYEGKFALEYEDGPWDGVEGAQYLYKEVLAALLSLTPRICIDCSPLLVRSAGVKTYLYHWLHALRELRPD